MYLQSRGKKKQTATSGGKGKRKPRSKPRPPQRALQARPSGPPKMPLSAPVSAYTQALRNPFSPGAIGARVPDPHSQPTVTYHFRSTYTMSSSASGTVSAFFLPSPCYSYISDFTGTMTAPTWTAVQSGGTQFAQNKPAGYLVSPTEMTSKLTEYRVVAWGLRLVAKDTATNTKGKIYLATTPTTANAPSWNTMNTVTAADLGVVSEYTCGTDIAFLNGNIQNLPSAKVFSMQDLLRGEIQVNGYPVTSSFYDFKGTTDRNNVAWNVNQVLADEGVFNNTAGLVNATAGGRKDIASLRGGSAVLLYATGLPASTNEFDVEVIYHLEGSPNVVSYGGGVTGLIPSAQNVVIGSTAIVETAIAKVRAAIPAIRQLTARESNDGGMMSYVEPALRIGKLMAGLLL